MYKKNLVLHLEAQLQSNECYVNNLMMLCQRGCFIHVSYWILAQRLFGYSSYSFCFICLHCIFKSHEAFIFPSLIKDTLYISFKQLLYVENFELVSGYLDITDESNMKSIVISNFIYNAIFLYKQIVFLICIFHIFSSKHHKF